MSDILNYFIKKSDLQKDEYFKYRQNTRKTTQTKKSEKIIQPLSQDIIYKDYIVFDLETTGLSPEKNNILEIGAVKVNNGKIVDKFDTLVNPNTFIPPFLEQKINITNNMVADKPFIEEIFPKFVNFLEDYVLIAHNARFDMSFLLNNAEKLGYKINNTSLDTLKLSRQAFPSFKSHSLGNLCRYLEISLTSAHRAYYDALATNEVYKKICENIKNNS